MVDLARPRLRAATRGLALLLALMTAGCGTTYYACRQGGGGRDSCMERTADFRSVAHR